MTHADTIRLRAKIIRLVNKDADKANLSTESINDFKKIVDIIKSRCVKHGYAYPEHIISIMYPKGTYNHVKERKTPVSNNRFRAVSRFANLKIGVPVDFGEFSKSERLKLYNSSNAFGRTKTPKLKFNVKNVDGRLMVIRAE